jgi:TRAP-type transport system periplasmic protein
MTCRRAKTPLAVITFLFSTLCFSCLVLAADRPITLKVTNFLVAQQLASQALEQWGRDLEAATGGRVKVKFYHNATLASTVQQYDAVRKGIADVCNHVLGFTVGRFPLTEVIDLPLGIPSGIAATRMMNEYYDRFRPKEFDEVKVLWLHGQGAGYLATKNKPVSTLEDLQGLKIRTHGGNARFIAALGGIPVAMPMADVYDALSRGMVDGLLSSMEALEGFRTGEHVRYVTMNRQSAYTACMLVAMNKKSWNSLSPDIQKIVDRLSRQQVERFGKAWDDAEIVGRNFMAKRGVKYIALTSNEEERWVAKGVQPLFNDYVKRMKERNLPGDQALKFVLDYLRPYRK